MRASLLADALGVLRVAVAMLLPWALAVVEGWFPLGLVLLAAATDYADGPLARRGPATRHGALLDNLADGAVVLAGTATGAALGWLPWPVPVAIVVSFGVYVYASSAGPSAAGWRPARSRLGHAAGVLNYGAVLAVGTAVAVPGPAWTTPFGFLSASVVLLNVAAVLARWWPRGTARA